jgi:hypothetical protein
MDELLQSMHPDLQDVLRRQHRQVLDCIRSGHIESLQTPSELKVEWLEAAAEPAGDGLALLFRVTVSSSPLGSAYLVGRLDVPDAEPVFADAETTAEGCATLQFAVPREAIVNSTVFIEAIHAGRKASARFLLHTHSQAVANAPTF